MKDIIEWPVVNSNHKIMVVFDGGLGGNFLSYLIYARVLGLTEDLEKIKSYSNSNEYISRTQYVYEQHLHMWFLRDPSYASLPGPPIQVDNMVISKQRYKFVLNNIKNNNMKIVVVTNRKNMHYTDRLKLLKWLKENGITELPRIPNSPAVLRKHKSVYRHYMFLIKQLKRYNVDHYTIDYTDFFIENNTTGLSKYFGSNIDISDDVREYHERNLKLMSEYGLDGTGLLC